MPANFERAVAANSHNRAVHRGKNRLFFPRAKLKAFTRFYVHSISNYSIGRDAEFVRLQEASDRREQQFSAEHDTRFFRRACSQRYAGRPRGDAGPPKTRHRSKRAGRNSRLPPFRQ